jgi:hypothetical protein
VRLVEVLTRHRDRILARMVDLYWEGDQGDAAFARKVADPFQNPVGAIVTGSLRDLYDGLAAGLGPADLASPIDRLVRLRAVQGFAPSIAVSFPLFVRRAVRESLLSGELAEAGEALADFESTERDLLLAVVDRYVACREQLYAGRLKSEVARVGAVLQRAGVVEPEEPAESWTGGAP